MCLIVFAYDCHPDYRLILGANRDEYRDRPTEQARFAEGLLPDTGVGPEWERLLSTIFIADEGYGTRSTTVLLIDRSGGVTFIERSFDHPQTVSTVQRYSFRIQPPTP